ncbi:MAG: cysteine--tRNA ligase [Candidatus Omnitrophota bacterium]
MTIKIYNSLTNSKEEFIPLQDKKVKMYACGVTVYDDCHIGHARAAFIFDFIRKYLVYKGYELTFVRNITDVDDKIINKARQELVKESKSGNHSEEELNKKVKEIAQKYTEKFYEDMNMLGIAKADVEPKATEHIPDIIEIIKVLIEKGFAYESAGDVYFEVKKFKDYGKLSNQSIEQMFSGVRKESEQNKKDPLDFALWKKSKVGEPAWPSPWSAGRPGWHIECSVMSMKYLGKTFDIHAGGIDLIFPHHENEVAQSEAATGQPFAGYWIHNGLLTINGEKMAKSLGNFVSIKELLSRCTAEDLKLFFLSSHYASPIDFSFEKVEFASNALRRFYILFNKIDAILKTGPVPIEKTNQEQRISVVLECFIKELAVLKEKFEEAMDDDFNTPAALSAMFEIVNLTNKFLQNNTVELERKKPALQSAKFALIEAGKIFGIFEPGEQEDMDMKTVDDLMNIIIETRDYARQKKDYELSDTIRNRLKEVGIIIEDEKGKTLWRKEK